jgi:hypothetical protein
MSMGGRSEPFVRDFAWHEFISRARLGKITQAAAPTPPYQRNVSTIQQQNGLNFVSI